MNNELVLISVLKLKYSADLSNNTAKKWEALLDLLEDIASNKDDLRITNSVNKLNRVLMLNDNETNYGSYKQLVYLASFFALREVKCDYAHWLAQTNILADTDNRKVYDIMFDLATMCEIADVFEDEYFKNNLLKMYLQIMRKKNLGTAEDSDLYILPSLAALITLSSDVNIITNHCILENLSNLNLDNEPLVELLYYCIIMEAAYKNFEEVSNIVSENIILLLDVTEKYLSICHPRFSTIASIADKLEQVKTGNLSLNKFISFMENLIKL